MNSIRHWRTALGLTIATLFVSPIAAAQNWIATYNSADNRPDLASGLDVDQSGNVYVAGLSMDESVPENRADFVVVKYDSAGSMQWTNGIPNVNRVCEQGIRNPIPPRIAAPVVDDSGNVYILGRTGGWECIDHPEGGSDLRLRKLSPDNRVLVDIIYDRDIHASVTPVLQLGPDGSIYMAANSTRFSGIPPYPPLQDVEIVVVKYDPAGGQVWECRIRDTSAYALRVKPNVAMRVDPSGSIYVAGSQDLDSTNADIVLLKFDLDGNLLWRQRYNHIWNASSPGVDQARLIELDPSGYIYIAGESSEPWVCTNCSPPSVPLLLKFDSDGTLLWAAEPGMRSVAAIAFDLNGHAFLAGLKSFTLWGGDPCATSGGDHVVQKRDPTGALIWERSYDSGDSLYDEALALAVDAAGNILVAGRVAGLLGPCWAPGSGSNIDTRMYDPDGLLLWNRRFAGPVVEGADIPVSIRTNVAGEVYVTGFSWGSSTDFDFATVKYHPCGISLEMFGDMTSDQTLTSADIIYLVRYIFKGGPPPPVCTVFGDVQCDGVVTAADIIWLVNHIFKGGLPPCSPDPCSHPLAGTCP